MNLSVYVFISGKEVIASFLNQKCNREGLWILSFKTWKHSFISTVRLTVHTNMSRIRTGAFQKHCSNRNNSKKEQWHCDNNVFSLPSVVGTVSFLGAVRWETLVTKLCRVDEKYLMRFQGETSDFKFLRRLSKVLKNFRYFEDQKSPKFRSREITYSARDFINLSRIFSHCM